MSINWNYVFGEEDEEEKKQKKKSGIDWDYVLGPVTIETKPPKTQSTASTTSKEDSTSTLDAVRNAIGTVDDKLENTKLFQWLQSRSPAKDVPEPGTPEYEEYLKEWSNKQASKPFRSGLVDTLSFGATPKIEKEIYGTSGLEKAKEEHPLKYAGGQLAGEALKTAAMYNVANPLAEKIPGINKINKPFLRTQATMLGADALVNVPYTLAEGAVEEKSGKEMLKDYAKRTAVDAAINLVVGGAGEAIKHFKKGKLAKIEVPEKTVQDTTKALPELSGEIRRLSRTSPEVVNVHLPGQENLNNIYREWNDAVDKFIEFRKRLNNGAFGKPATDVEFELFKDYSGIDIFDILKRMETAENIKPKDTLNKLAEKRRLGEVAGVYEPVKIKKDLVPKSLKDFKETEPIIPQEMKLLPKKDIKPLDKSFVDFYRNMEKAYGKNFDIVNDAIIKPFNQAKKANIDMQKEWTDKAYNYVVKELGIKKGSKLSALVQRYGEGNISEAELLKILKPEEVDKIKKANQFFKEAYDTLLKRINEARAIAYSNDPDMLIKPRKDYYRHFQDTAASYAEKMKKILNMGDSTPKVSSKQRKPLSSYFSIGKERKGGQYTEDAVGGFLDYIKAASYATHIDTQIPKIRELANSINDLAPNKYQNFVNYLHEFADDLAGKQNPLDKSIQSIIGRRAFTVLDKLNSRVRANVILGNISSSLSQIANVPQGIATIKDPVALTKGAGDTLAGIIGKGKMKQIQQASPFLNERYANDLYSRFDSRIIDQPKKFATWLLEAMDEVGTKFIWNSSFRKAVKDGAPNPIEYADDITRKMVAGRGVGELPLVQKSRIFQIIAPFQVEVTNLWHVQKDMVKEKDFAGLVLFYIANFVLNEAMENIRGSGVTFDPIRAIDDAIKDEDPSLGKAVGRLSGEVLSNMPLGQSIAATLVPEQYREQLFGEQDPTRYGTGLPLEQAFRKPLNLLLPWGGGQLSKTAKGLTALGAIPELNPTKENFGEYVEKPGVYIGSGEEKKLRYPIENTPKARLQTLLFGPTSTNTARQFYKEDMKVLSPNQTQQVENGMDYNTLQKLRKIESLKNKIDKTAKDSKLTTEEKEKEINKLVEQIEQLVNELGG